MKKIIVLVLALVMVVAMGFANQTTATGDIPVNITVLPHVELAIPEEASFDLTYDPEGIHNVESDSVDVTVSANTDYAITADYTLDSGITLPSALSVGDYYTIDVNAGSGSAGVNNHTVTFSVDFGLLESDLNTAGFEWTDAEADDYLVGTVNLTVSVNP